MATLDARKIEAEILRRLNKALELCETEHKDNVAYRHTVIGKNNALWAHFVDDLSKPSNPLEPETKLGLMRMARFSFDHGDKVLRQKASVAPLIEINHAVEQGLMGIE